MDSVRMGSTMSRVLWISVTRQACPGVRVSPGVAQRAFQSRLLGRNGGQHPGFPAKGAVTVGGGGLLVQPFGQRLECQQADRADRNEHHRLHPE